MDQMDVAIQIFKEMEETYDIKVGGDYIKMSLEERKQFAAEKCVQFLKYLRIDSKEFGAILSRAYNLAQKEAKNGE
jgi:hypothetical protein